MAVLGAPPNLPVPVVMPKQQNPNATVYTVGASEYGRGESGHSCPKGPADVGGKAFAELGMGSMLGGLPCGTQLKIEAIGSSHKAPVIASKVDIGLGGAPVQGHARRIDLYYQTAEAIGFKGTGLVRISRLDGKPIIGPGDKKSGSQESEAVPSNIIPSPNLEGLTEWASQLGKILSFLASSSGWLRIGKVVLGAGLLVIALDLLMKVGPGPDTNVSGAAKGAVSKTAKVRPPVKAAKAPQSAVTPKPTKVRMRNPSDAYLNSLPVT